MLWRRWGGSQSSFNGPVNLFTDSVVKGTDMCPSVHVYLLTHV